MTARILDGAAIARQIREEVKAEALAFVNSGGLKPGLGALLVGDDPASHIYVASKTKACEELGLFHATERLPSSATTEEVLAVVDKHDGGARCRQVPRSPQSLEPLLSHPLRGEPLQPLGAPPSRRPGLRLNGEPEAGREPDGAEDPEEILANAVPRRPDRPDHSGVNVLPSPEGIAPFVTDRVVGDGVDGEVPPGQVFVERGAEGNDCVTAIGLDVAAEGGHLVKMPAPVEHADRPVADAHRNGVRKEPEHHLRWRRGHEVHVALALAEERVAQRPAHRPGLVTGGLEGGRNLHHLLRQVHPGRECPGLSHRGRCLRSR